MEEECEGEDERNGQGEERGGLGEGRQGGSRER